MGTLLFISFLVLISINIPIGLALGAASAIAILWQGEMPLLIIPQRLFAGSDSFILLAIPFFMLAGQLMYTGGIARRLFHFCNVLLGHIIGALAHVNILVSMLFAGITGSAPADTSSIGSVLIPEMKRCGYDRDFSAAVTAASSIIGVIIPPSIPMVIFAVTTGIPLTRLFLAGFIPGIMVGLGLMLVSYFISRKNNYFSKKKFNWKEVWPAFIDGFWALFMPVIIMGGILTGVFTPTEAGVIAVVYGFIIAKFVYKELNFKDIPNILVNTVISSASVMLVVVNAQLYGWILTFEEIPQKITVFLLGITNSNPLILLIILGIFICAGTIMDLGANIIIFVPLMLPLITKIGMDITHFALLTIVALSIGLTTPPIAICVFLAADIAKSTVMNVAKALVPFILVLLFVLLLLAFIPGLTLFVPNLLTP